MTNEFRRTTLPIEIQHSIFRHLTFHERLLCSTVSRSWRLLILNWPDMWERLSTDDGHNITPNLLRYKRYIHGAFVKHLCLKQNIGNENHVSDVIDFVIEQGCSRIEQGILKCQKTITEKLLRTLPLFYIVELFLCTTMNPTKFFKFVVSCKDSLTSIVLDIRQDDAQFCLAPEQILLHCQSLVKLHYISRVLQKHAAWTPSIAEFQHMRLIDLTLQLGCPSGTFDPSPFLKSAPNLRRLSLNGMEIDVRYSVVLSSLLCQHCPLLSSLHIAAEINEEMSLNDTAWQVQQMPGLIEFSMSDRFERFSGYGEILRQIIKEWHRHLTILKLERSSLFDEVTLEFLSKFELTSLYHLELNFSDCGHAPDNLPYFLTRSVPNLRSLKLDTVLHSVNRNFLQTLASSMKRLNRLELQCHFLRGLHPYYLVNVFDIMAAHSLRTIIFRYMSTLTIQVLKAIITKYPVINELGIHHCYNVSIQGLSAFLSSLDRNMGKIDLTIFHEDGSINHNSARDDIIGLLGALEKVANQWKLCTEFPQTWVALPCTTECFPYKSIDHKEYRAYRSHGKAVL